MKGPLLLLNPFVLVALAVSLAGLGTAQAQPTIVSTVPANGASGVSPSAPVVFTFSEAMDPDLTEAMFIDISNPMGSITTSSAWSAGNTVLTCTPSPAFPANKTLYWTVNGESAGGVPLNDTPPPFGSFATSSGGSGGETPSGTNAVTAFTAGVIYGYVQNSATAVVPQELVPYLFMATTVLASNRTANGVSLQLPTGATTNLTRNTFAPEDFTAMAYSTSATALDGGFPAGAYRFSLQSTNPLQATVTLAATNTQPNPPHISNFAAAQSVPAAQAFTLTWDPFQNGTASDYIWIHVTDQTGKEVFKSPDFGQTNALKGTVTSIVLPANLLQPDTTNDITVGFYRFAVATNTANNYVTEAYRATATTVTLVTTGGSLPSAPVLNSVALTPGGIQLRITATPGQNVTIEYTSNLTGGWQKLTTTNSPSGIIQYTDPISAGNQARFYRVRTGS